MAKAKIKTSDSISVEGYFDNDNLAIEVDDIGVKNLKDLFIKYNGEYVTITIKKKDEIMK